MVLQNGKLFETINNCRVFVVIVVLLGVLCVVRAAPISNHQSRNSGADVNSTKLTASCPLDWKVDFHDRSCKCSSLGDLVLILHSTWKGIGNCALYNNITVI